MSAFLCNVVNVSTVKRVNMSLSNVSSLLKSDYWQVYYTYIYYTHSVSDFFFSLFFHMVLRHLQEGTGEDRKLPVPWINKIGQKKKKKNNRNLEGEKSVKKIGKNRIRTCGVMHRLHAVHPPGKFLVS